MTVYLSSVDQELLYAIRAIEVLLESGVGVAEAMKHVADEDYGDLSGVFKQIFRDTDSEEHLVIPFVLNPERLILQV